MDYPEVKILLIRKNITQADIARDLGITPGAVYFILSGERPGYRYQRMISQILGVKISELFVSTKRRKSGPRPRPPLRPATRIRRQTKIIAQEDRT